MNKIRIIGLLVLSVGIIIQFTLENDVTDFISGILIGGGIGLTLTGIIGKSKNNWILNLSKLRNDSFNWNWKVWEINCQIIILISLS